MEAKRGVMSCVFVIVLITMACMVTAVEECSSSASAGAFGGRPSEYEVRKRRQWNTFLLYLKKHKPPLTLDHCSGAHVIEFLKYLDQFGKTKVHVSGCQYFGNPKPPAPCTPCPLMQAWGSLETMIKMLSISYAEKVGPLEWNPFTALPVRIYLRQAREYQAKASGVSYKRKRRKRATIGEADGASHRGAGSEPANDFFFM